ncbi:flotillin family protein [Clostridium beijerinckii]|uniref:flotillin family protein n=1 Tax=Clostridium beijerinckii TaxID=1520 RepID=UPI000809BF2D|nr:flotillin [Clostridium beijerinckii]MBE6089088.1 flotillin family protein [Clostridium beijerinckii]OCA98667.1 flotillin [Clostridium beijerinckii]
MSYETQVFLISIVAAVIIIGGLLAMFAKFYNKVDQGKVIVRNGVGGPVVSFGGILVLPVLHKSETMDISVKRVEIAREGKDGLICKDNLRADIRVAFFVRVNQTREDVLKVAQLLGCAKASDPLTLMEFFDAKFSEALKTVGKKFDFVQLYTERETFKDEILQIIGTDLNGYVLDDAAIDYLEQTDIKLLNSSNILDSEGIKKITELTSEQLILANQIERDKEKTIKKQDVSAREAILELEKQNAEAEAKQKREISIIRAREEAEAEKVRQEERYKSEMARVKSDEEIEVAEQNKERQVIIAMKAKESTDAVETERVEKKRLLERTEKEKLVELANIDKQKEVEVEKKNIQTIIRERVTVEKDTVIEEEKIKDTRVFAEANRVKSVAVKKAEEEAETNLIIEVKTAEASKEAAERIAEKTVIDADAKYKASQKEAEAIKILADANIQNEATSGMAEAKIIEAKAIAEAKAIESRTLAQAKGDSAMVEVKEKEGTVEADILKKKYMAEAEGIKEKANSMKALDEVGREHEEFKLKLEKEKEVELANINIQKEIAESQASVINEALKAAKIDIVGGETMFFDQIIGSVTKGKSYDRLVKNSEVLSDIKETFITGDPDYFKKQLSEFMDRFNLNSEDIKNLSIAGAINKMMSNSEGADKKALSKLLETVNKAGVASLPAGTMEFTRK